VAEGSVAAAPRYAPQPGRIGARRAEAQQLIVKSAA
jgi:hypothetical protein